MADSADTELLPVPDDPRLEESASTRSWLSLLAALLGAADVALVLRRSIDDASDFTSVLCASALAIPLFGWLFGLQAGASRRGKIGILANGTLLMLMCGYVLGRKG
jgi:hypothetical protein